METINIRGMEIVKGTSVTPQEYQRIMAIPVDTDPLGLREDEKEMQSLLDEISSDVSFTLESYKELTRLNSFTISSESESLINYNLNLITKVINNNINHSLSLENRINDADEKLIENLFNKAKELVNAINKLITKVKEYSNNRFELSLNLFSKLDYILKNLPQDSITLKFTPSEASFFYLGEDFNIIETMSLYLTTVERLASNSSLLENISQYPKITKLVLVPPLVYSSKSQKENNFYYYSTPLPKDYILSYQLPIPEYYSSLTLPSEEAIYSLDNSLILLKKVNNNHPNKDILLRLDKEYLNKLNKLQVNFNESNKFNLIHLQKLSLALEELSISLNKNNLINLSTLNKRFQMSLLRYLLNYIREPLVSLLLLSHSTNDILLSKLISLIHFYQNRIKI